MKAAKISCVVCAVFFASIALASAGPVILAAMLLVAVPGYFAARVGPELGFES